MNSLAEADPMERSARWFGAFGSAERKALFQPEINSSLADVHSFARQLIRQQSNSSTLRLLQIQDHAQWLPANLLLRSDRVTMANSLELRCPFLDPRIVDFALHELPDNFKIHRGQSKWILRQVAKEILPAAIYRRRKWGFKVPVGEWFRGPLKPYLHQVLFSTAAANRGYFDLTEVRRLYTEHTEYGADHSKKLWCLFQLELWHMMFTDHTLKAGDDLRSI
jgi:asparagine synthase (glutamine-hydrolysing)